MVYSPSGVKRDGIEKGLNIIVYSNGEIKKYISKQLTKKITWTCPRVTDVPVSQTIMQAKTSNIIGFVATIIALFAKKHKYSEPVVYHYISKYGGDKLLVNHYDYLHTQDYDQVVDDLNDYCHRQGGTL